MSSQRVIGRRDIATLRGALVDDEVVGLPGPGGYWLAVRAKSDAGVRRLVAMVTDAAPGGDPHFMVGHRSQARTLASEWTDATNQLIVRCWPGPLTVILPVEDAVSESGTVQVSMAGSRPLRHLCRECGPWRVMPLDSTLFSTATSVQARFAQSQVALIIDGGSIGSPGSTLVDCTLSPARVLREGALPAMFIQAAQIMGGRRRFRFGRAGVSGTPRSS